MRTTTLVCLFALVAACGAAEPTSPRPSQQEAATYAGWYLEHAGQPSFQPCGQSQRLRIVAAADLPERAKAFGLDEDTPVYVRLKGAIAGGEMRVESVEQFGSPTPVRDCGLDGVVIPEPVR